MLLFQVLTFTFLFFQGLTFEMPALYQLTSPIDHGEGPTWDTRKGLLYYVDLHAGKIYSYNYDNDVINYIKLNGDVTVVVPSRCDPNLLIAGVNRSIVAIKWDGESNEIVSSKLLTTVANDKPTSRFNDGKADKEGRLWFGTMGFEDSSGVTPNEGSLYFVTNDNIVHPQVVISPVNVSNGLAWNKANNKLYYIDSPTQQIIEYNYDNDKGKISNPRVVFDLKSYPLQLSPNAVPDGMTIDKDDNLWVALYNGGAVIKINPKNGKLLQIIGIPSKYVTSVSWGGPFLDVLFVTTSRFNLNASERLQQPAAGSLFAITKLNTHGLPTFQADVVDCTETL